MRKAKTPLARFLLNILNKSIQKEPLNNFSKSRREFLKTTAKTATVASLASLLPLGACNRISNPRIAIVGGGMAGLNCGYQLFKAGFDFTLYEGDKRIGGRMYSRMDLFGENMSTEFGAEFLDTDHAEMLSLVEEFELELIDTHQDDVIRDTFYFEGRTISEEEVIAEFQKAIPIIMEDRLQCGDDYDTEKAIELDNLSLDRYWRTLGISDWFEDLLDRAYMAEFGLECREQSSLNFVSMIGLDTSEGFKVFGESDERFKVVGGNDTIPKKIAEKIEGKIRYEHLLQSIQKIGSRYKLKFSNSEEVSADIVVMCIPFTVLRNIEIKVADVSPEKLACINELGYGQNNKIMLAMSSRVWRQMNPSRAGYLVHSSIHNGWDNGHMQGNNEGDTGYTIFLGGKTSHSYAEIAKEAQLKDKLPPAYASVFAETLDKIYPGFKASFKDFNYAAFWTNNPFVQGSYTCFKTGQWAKFSNIIGERAGNLFFAGEHCSLEYSGYMNGAAETGRSAAELIIQENS